MVKKRTINKAIRLAGNQSKLAEYLGIPRQYMSEIMRGLRPFPKGRIDKLHELLNKTNTKGL